MAALGACLDRHKVRRWSRHGVVGMGSGRQNRRMVCLHCSCPTLLLWLRGATFAVQFRDPRPRRAVMVVAYDQNQYRDAMLASSSLTGGAQLIACGSLRREGLLWGYVRGRLRLVRRHKSWREECIRTIENITFVVAGFPNIGGPFVTGDACANATVHPLLFIIVARRGEARPPTPRHAAAATPPAPTAVPATWQPAAHGRVQTGVAASTPCCREAECLERLLVLWVHCTAVLERWHLLAGLVVVVVCIIRFGGLAALDLAERSAFSLTSQCPPQAGT
jgi:hypothetical protein